MELSATELFSDTEVEDLTFIDEWESLDQDFSSTKVWHSFQETLSSESTNSCAPCFESPLIRASVEEPEKFPEPDKNWRFSSTNKGILSFGYPCLDAGLETLEFVSMEVKQEKVKRPRTVNQDHVIAERKRREKISEQFFTLSKIIPGVKRRDKASILKDTINYLQQMEQKLKVLEEQATKEIVENAMVSARKSQPSAVNDERGNNSPSADILLDIEAKMSGKTILMKIHCKNRRGVLLKALCEIENLHLSVITLSALSFSDHFLDISVTTQVEKGFSMTVKDLLKELNSAFRTFM